MTTRTASCPNCGAEITFRWSGAVQTSCPACKSVLVRHNLDLERVGTVGDVPASMSRIQLGSEGQYKGKSFVAIGRIVYKHQRGHWSEWYIRFGDGSDGWLSDAQAEYAVTRLVEAAPHLPTAEEVRPGIIARIAGGHYTVSAITRAAYSGVEGELPFTYWDKSEVMFADLKKDADSFATIDYSEDPPMLFVGEYEEFDELRFRNLRDTDAPSESAGPRSKGLNCPQCGAAIELRTGELVQTIACPACTAILDASDENVSILEKHQHKTRHATPAIPLGTIGSLKGQSWQVVGFRVAGIEVEGVSYTWREYLLWNPTDGGFRYLTEYEGHWNDVSVIKGVPKELVGGAQPVLEYVGTRFKHFQSATAKTHFVLGEFPWEVRVGDEVDGDDFVAPPLMLSRESTGDEITWSLGTYTAPERIVEAFKLKEALPKPIGVFANQPSPRAGITGAYWRAFLVLLVALVGVAVLRQATARNEKAFTAGYHAVGGGADTTAFVTPEFELTGHTSNVEVELTTALNNDWAFFNMALLAVDGGKGYEFGRNVSYYYGVDQGESWNEGSPRDRVLLSSIPPGRYYLRVEPERDVTGRPFNYAITVRRDVPRMWPFVVVFFVLLIPAIFASAREASFEAARWRESDHAPVESGDDDDEE